MLASQPRVTGPIGNLPYPPLFIIQMASSHSMRRTFDIVKAEVVRKASGLTYADLARALKYERQTVGHWFRGRGEPSVQQMKGLALEMGCHWLQLVKEDTMIVFQEDEVRRLERLRSLSPQDLAEMDAFLAFKAANKGENDEG